MKHFLLMTFFIFFLMFIFSSERINGQCPNENPDKLYNREKVLKQIIEILNASVPNYIPKDPGFYIAKNGTVGGFFIYDLSDTSNHDTPESNNCINFIDKHIYHFAPYKEEYSASHILYLENGDLKAFKSINCNDSKHSLRDVVTFLEKKLKSNKDKDEILFRVKNYRRYGSYILLDYPTNYYCVDRKPTNTNNYSVNSDNLFKSKNVLLEFSNVLNRSIPEYRNYFNRGFFSERSKAIGFFVYDLTDPRNKQTSQDELVYFVKNHIYHFAPIDLPWSYSFIAVLGDDDMKIFKMINCEGKGDSLDDVISYLNLKFKNNKEKDTIIKRVKNFRDYGVYASFNDLSKPQCKDLISIEN